MWQPQSMSHARRHQHPRSAPDELGAKIDKVPHGQTKHVQLFKWKACRTLGTKVNVHFNHRFAIPPPSAFIPFSMGETCLFKG